MSSAPQRAEFHNPKILVFRGGALGDFILTLPALSFLRRRWPGADIEIVGHEKSAGLALATGLVDRLQSLDSARLALYFQKETGLPPAEIKYIRSFDLIVSYLHDPDHVLYRNLKEAGAQQVIAASPLIKKGHAAEHFLKTIKDVIGDKFGKTFTHKTLSRFIKCDNRELTPLEQRRCSSSAERPDVLLEWPPLLKKKARRRLLSEIGEKHFMVVHPGSGSPAKNWPVKKFAGLAKKIRAETSLEPLIIGGEADTKEIASLRSLLPDFHIHDNLPLLDVASILSVAGGFIGNDSGITHLAAALGTPVVALFGPTDPAVWAPRGENVLIIKSRFAAPESLAEIGIEKVFSALKKKTILLY